MKSTMDPRDTLTPRPIGWFAIARSAELRRGALVRGVLATVPYTLRRRHDGSLQSEELAELVEQNGVVLAWHHPDGAPPTWRVPRLDPAGWRSLWHHTLHARSHPQETFENSIDLAHFPVIHGYTDISVLQPMTTEGPSLSVRYQIARALPRPLAGYKLRPRFEVRLHGIGVAHNHIELDPFGLRVRMLAMSTPTTPGEVDIRLAVAVRATRPALTPVLPLLHLAAAAGVVHDFRQDMAVWESKRYLGRPVLAEGDGPVGAFRKWCRQFYPASPASTSAHP